MCGYSKGRDNSRRFQKQCDGFAVTTTQHTYNHNPVSQNNKQNCNVNHNSKQTANLESPENIARQLSHVFEGQPQNERRTAKSTSSIFGVGTNNRQKMTQLIAMHRYVSMTQTNNNNSCHNKLRVVTRLNQSIKVKSFSIQLMNALRSVLRIQTSINRQSEIEFSTHPFTNCLVVLLLTSDCKTTSCIPIATTLGQTNFRDYSKYR